MHCCHHSWFYKIADYIGYNGFELYLSVLAISVFGSFMHCIGMCGPIASARYSMRLMNGDLKHSKIKYAMDYSYYFGKMLSYIIIASLIYFVSFKLKDGGTSKYVIFTALIMLSILFILIAIDFKLINRFSLKFSNNKLLARHSKKFHILSGFILGFIPCGYLYAVLAMIALKSDWFINVLIATCIFAIGTVPGLFIVAYSGNTFLYRYKKIFKLFFKISMVVNAALIAKYALKLL